MTCALPTCTVPAQSRGYCERHYRNRVHAGHFGWRDAKPARRHVLELRQRQWTIEAIAEAAGVSMNTVNQLRRGRATWVLAETERSILAVPPTPRTWRHGIDPTGTRRRLRALMWLGWPARDIAERIGVRTCTIAAARANHTPPRPVSGRVAADIARVFEQLATTPGPSPQAASKARNRGYPPPAAWDDGTIDDPDAQPEGLACRASGCANKTRARGLCHIHAGYRRTPRRAA